MTTIDRRYFLGLSATALASLLLPSCLSASKSNKALGVALLGLGSYSTNQLAPALEKTQYCKLVGIITGSPEKIPRWQRKYGIPDQNVYSYENMNQIANNDQIDVVYVVTPTGTHADFTIAAANTGKHVWCEKPMAISTEECNLMIKACEQNKVKLTLGYRMQHEPNTLLLNSYAQSLPFGKIDQIDAAAGYNGGVGTDWRFKREMGGGALYDMGVYTVNGMRNALNMEPTSVISAKQYANRSGFNEVDETTEYVLQFPKGIKGYGKTSVGKNMNHLRITCKQGWYETRPMQSYHGVKGKRSDGLLLNQYIENQQAKQMDDDALAIINHEEMSIQPTQGLYDVRIIQAILKSSIEEKEVRI